MHKVLIFVSLTDVSLQIQKDQQTLIREKKKKVAQIHHSPTSDNLMTKKTGVLTEK
jgi:hypothetical protein